MSRKQISEQWVTAQCARLKYARAQAGYTQESMAEELGIAVKTYAKYESRTPLPQDKICTVCRLLDLDPFVFLDGIGRDAQRPKPKAPLKRVK